MFVCASLLSTGCFIIDAAAVEIGRSRLGSSNSPSSIQRTGSTVVLFAPSAHATILRTNSGPSCRWGVWFPPWAPTLPPTLCPGRAASEFFRLPPSLLPTLRQASMRGRFLFRQPSR